MLMERAETMLWPATERRAPWRDIVHRAVTNSRWLWLPPKGLETLKRSPSAKDDGAGPRTVTLRRGRSRLCGPRCRCPSGTIRSRPARRPSRSLHATLDLTAACTIRRNRTSRQIARSFPDTIFETDETALYFLAVDPDGQHETGEVVPWQNRLTLTHRPRILPGKRIVELTVKPRGTIRWTTTGRTQSTAPSTTGRSSSPSEADVTIFAYAEDKGVSTSRNFLIPSAEQGSFAIDPTKPAHLRKKLHYRGNNEAFAALNTVKGLQVRLGNVSVEIGEGARNVITRFGSETVIAPEDLEQFIATARRAIGDDTAEVKLGFGDLRFSSGHDLETFLAKLGVEIGAGEVDQ